MGALPFKVGDRVRFLTTMKPDQMRVGTINGIGSTPDTSGNLLYFILVEQQDEPDTAIHVAVDTVNILLMEEATDKRRQTSD